MPIKCRTSEGLAVLGQVAAAPIPDPSSAHPVSHAELTVVGLAGDVSNQEARTRLSSGEEGASTFRDSGPQIPELIAQQRSPGFVVDRLPGLDIPSQDPAPVPRSTLVSHR